ncbi:hypothetical protein UP09_11700 [Bradyrhizobium sp. LTSP885]|uniref:hypothetical protein n=1 Tax=Bradyrhizobium sp. LTSP885 TaxID=1619232 RepID=UPI0005C8EE1B|nr:hypothetical protein [Bradyrhizobium sp. LTSP885]KJC46688.1 hypothetical protein UP09_11700 [Bradyrhizobium sp. LTSP885]
MIEAIKIPRAKQPADSPHIVPGSSTQEPDQKVLQSLARVHAWQRDLASGRFASIEDLAVAIRLHPKVIRGELRLAFLAPNILKGVLYGEIPATLRDLRKVQALSWQGQKAELYDGL